MIGFWSFVEELSFVLLPLFLLSTVIVGIRHLPKSSGGFSVKGTWLYWFWFCCLRCPAGGWSGKRTCVASSDHYPQRKWSLFLSRASRKEPA